MKRTITHITFAIALGMALAACEKPTDDSGNPTESNRKDYATVRFNARQIAQAEYDDGGDSSATRAGAATLADMCSRISMGVFDADGNNLKTISQESKDSKFGDFSISLPKGSYTFVFIAHNGLGNATLSSPSKITFKDNKVTDTFYSCQDIDISSGGNHDITLHRAVAMVKLGVNDKTPAGVKQMKLYYTGGSSTFDATTGYGCVNSKQTEYRTVAASAYNGPSDYCIYTFPHNPGKKLKLVVTAMKGTDTSADIECERTITDIPVRKNNITNCPGNFFSAGGSQSSGFNLRIDDEWTQEYYEY